jgi:zinc protease
MSMPPKSRTPSILRIAAIVCFFIAVQPVAAQPGSTPESEELLNGLKVLFWPKPGSSEVLVKLRIHSGSAFDLAGKSGEMALLGDILFPDPETGDFFTEQMGGKLNVVVNYDSITITMLGKADQLNNILDVLRNAILSTQLTAEVVTRIREARLKMVRDTMVSPATVADRAIAVRLFGTFPYGRPSPGSPEDLARVERADLMLARDRFLNSNNATLAISGGVTQARAMRTLKQLFGPWRKSEQVIPSTFSAAKPPDPRTLIVNVPGSSAEVRLALRGVSRSDKDFHAALVLARVMQHRWQELNPELAAKPSFVRSESYVLPGSFVLGTAVNPQSSAAALVSAKKVIEALVTTPVTGAELERSRNEVVAETNAQTPRLEAEADAWLDMYTYRLSEAQNNVALLVGVSAADVQRLASRLLKDASVATVIVGDAQALKPAIQGQLQFEVLGEAPETIPTPKPPTKPGSSSSPS